jgi:hypothetical protein
MRALRCGDSGSASGSTPLPLGSGRCTGADTSGMATSTQTASMAVSPSGQAPGSGDVGVQAGDPVGGEKGPLKRERRDWAWSDAGGDINGGSRGVHRTATGCGKGSHDRIHQGEQLTVMEAHVSALSAGCVQASHTTGVGPSCGARRNARGSNCSAVRSKSASACWKRRLYRLRTM